MIRTFGKQENLFPYLEELLEKVERPSRYINHEWGAAKVGSKSYRICLTYPDVYEVGQPNQGLSILYKILNAHPEIDCERSYLPWIDMAEHMRERNIPLCALESMTPIYGFDMLGIQLPHEMAFTNILELLDMSALPLYSADRAEDDPFVVGGGPSVYNPEPMAAFYDAFVIGEGEEVMIELCECHMQAKREGLSRKETLERFAEIEGIYVPSLYEELKGEELEKYRESTKLLSRLRPISSSAKPVITKRIVKEFWKTDPLTTVLVPFEETVHDRLSIEVLRGCARGCRFCQAGMIYRPVRERPQDQIVSSVLEGLQTCGYDEVSLTSLSTTDHSELPDVLRRLDAQLKNSAVRISIPSQRLDSFGVEMAELVAGTKKGGLTFAPEAGTQRMRDVINKNITEENLDLAVKHAFEAGWRRLKLYFMMGLPTETDEDIIGIGKLAKRAYDIARESCPPDQRGGIQISVSVSVFIPKSHTPFQWCGQLEIDEVKRRQQLLRDSMPARGVRLAYHEADTSYLEAVLSRGGREVSELVMRAWELGCKFDAWTDQFKMDLWLKAADEIGFDLIQAACAELEHGKSLPWGHIDAGVSHRYLELEWKRACAEKTTVDCTFDHCTACGVCPSLKTSNDLAGERCV